MTSPADTVCYKHHRFPGEIIRHRVWLSYRFTLSYRDAQELLFEHGGENEGAPALTPGVSLGAALRA
jgi:hypothetical protein